MTTTTTTKSKAEPKAGDHHTDSNELLARVAAILDANSIKPMLNTLDTERLIGIEHTLLNLAGKDSHLNMWLDTYEAAIKQHHTIGCTCVVCRRLV